MPTMEASLELAVADFLDAVASEDSAPGAGTVAALAAAAAAGLTAMAARSSLEWADAAGVTAQAETLRSRLTELAEANAEAYAEARASLREQGGSDFALGAALTRAAAVPLEIADVAACVAQLAAVVAEEAEVGLRPDAAAAALLADGAARAAAHLVCVNLGVTPTDDRVRRAQRIAADAAAASARAVATVA